MNLKIIATADGSHTLLNESINETYHSVHGAIQESMHVFIKHGAEHAYHESKKPHLSIFEIGFGTGLNALLTAKFAQEHSLRVHYTSIEAYPLDERWWSQLNYPSLLNMSTEYNALHRASWNGWQEVCPYFSIRKLHTKLSDLDLDSEAFDLIYFDAFAPSRQPEMWSLDNVEKIVKLLGKRGVLVTYCAKGQLKRDFLSLGFQVETLPGPPGKKEMVRVKNL